MTFDFGHLFCANAKKGNASRINYVIEPFLLAGRQRFENEVRDVDD